MDCRRNVMRRPDLAYFALHPHHRPVAGRMSVGRAGSAGGWARQISAAAPPEVTHPAPMAGISADGRRRCPTGDGRLPGQQVTLDGSQSSIRPDTLSFVWIQTAGTRRASSDTAAVVTFLCRRCFRTRSCEVSRWMMDAVVGDGRGRAARQCRAEFAGRVAGAIGLSRRVDAR